MTDFEEAGELGVFIDEEQLRALEEKMNKRGYLEGSEMATTFNMLRANDLIWSFVVNNYLLGNEPFPFDLLYWNSDSTRMPARDAQLLSAQDVPGEPARASRRHHARRRADRPRPDRHAALFHLDARGPYRAVEIHLSRHAVAGREQQALRARRHRATSPASSTRRRAANTATGSTPSLPPDPEAWLAGATEMAGSWWPDWQRWVTALDKTQVPARQPGDGKLKPIEDAPGSYVRVKIA